MKIQDINISTDDAMTRLKSLQNDIAKAYAEKDEVEQAISSQREGIRSLSKEETLLRQLIGMFEEQLAILD
jgi:predicted  nucleic acid-binding Zn-ribbon protein